MAAATTALTAAAPRAAGAVSSALGDKLAGAHALVAGDAAYFCDRARRHAARRRREGAIRSLAAGLRAARRDVADGATGALESLLVDAPRSADARSAAGALLGVLVKPAVGAADAVASLASGLASGPCLSLIHI